MPEGSKPRRWHSHLVKMSIALIGCGLAAALAYRLSVTYDVDEILESIRTMPAFNIATGAAFAAASYVCLTFFDWLGLRYVGHPQAYARAAVTSFTSLSIGHNIGFAGLSSGAIRYRFYSMWGLTLTDVAKLIAFCGVTVALGLTTVAGLSLLLKPSAGEAFLGMSTGQVRLVGAALLSIPAIYLSIARDGRSLQFFRWSVVSPGRRYAAAQIFLGTLNYLCVAGCLHQMIAFNNNTAYADVAAAYVIANTAAIISHVPGGLGVLESVALYLLPGASVLGGLVMFRIVYYLAPLAAGLVVFASAELLRRRRRADTAIPKYLAAQKS